jgi:hypothetical protein
MLVWICAVICAGEHTVRTSEQSRGSPHGCGQRSCWEQLPMTDQERIAHRRVVQVEQFVRNEWLKDGSEFLLYLSLPDVWPQFQPVYGVNFIEIHHIHYLAQARQKYQHEHGGRVPESSPNHSCHRCYLQQRFAHL